MCQKYIGCLVWGQKACEKKHPRQGFFGIKMSYLCLHSFLSPLNKAARVGNQDSELGVQGKNEWEIKIFIQ